VTAKSIKKAAKDETPPLLDKTGLLIPTAIERDWDRSKDLAEFMLSRISQVKVALEKGMEDESEIFTEVTNSTLSKLKYIYQDLKRLEPHAVCTSCQGSTSKEKCSLCGHRGFISEFIYRNCSPEETRKIREAK
jgi:hypothetical protein